MKTRYRLQVTGWWAVSDAWRALMRRTLCRWRGHELPPLVIWWQGRWQCRRCGEWVEENA